jgi:hypothetical protein
MWSLMRWDEPNERNEGRTIVLAPVTRGALGDQIAIHVAGEMAEMIFLGYAARSC